MTTTNYDSAQQAYSSYFLAALRELKKILSQNLRQAGRQGLAAERQDSRQKLVSHLGTWVF